MIYIIIQNCLFEFSFLNNKNEIEKFFVNMDGTNYSLEVRSVLRHKGLGFETIKEAKECRQFKPVFGNVKFYDIEKKEEVR